MSYHIVIQGDHGSLTKGFVDIDLVCFRAANDHDHDQIFGLDCPIPTDYRHNLLPIIVLHRP